MKTTAIQLTKQYIHDNKDFIIGNISDHLLYNFWNDENSFYNYLTDDEVEEMNNNVDLTHKRGVEVEEFIKENFNYNIENFIY